MIRIRHAENSEKRKVFEWLCLSDTTPMHMGEPDYPDNPIADWEGFQADFEDFYFDEKRKAKGAVMIIEDDGIGIGCVCYACFHLKPGAAELDIWMSNSKYCGKGLGSEALRATIMYLESELGIKRFIIRPSEKNARAIRAYEKVGFQKVSNKEQTLLEYLEPMWQEIHGDGDYGFHGTAILILE